MKNNDILSPLKPNYKYPLKIVKINSINSTNMSLDFDSSHVRCSPFFNENLISVSQLTKQLNCYVSSFLRVMNSFFFIAQNSMGNTPLNLSILISVSLIPLNVFSSIDDCTKPHRP